MTDLEKQTAFAEFLGWKNIHLEVWDCEIGLELVGIPPVNHGSCPKISVPLKSYLPRDLDTMRMAVLKLTDAQIAQFNIHLYEIVNNEPAKNGNTGAYPELDCAGMVCFTKATISQRADALLKTIGKL